MQPCGTAFGPHEKQSCTLYVQQGVRKRSGKAERTNDTKNVIEKSFKIPRNVKTRLRLPDWASKGVMASSKETNR